MRELRGQLRSGALFSVLLAAALFMRILVPTGWMPVADASGLHFKPCPGWTGKPQPEQAAHHHGHHGGDHAHSGKDSPQEGEPEHSDQPCAFAGLGMASLEAATPPSVAPLPFQAMAAAAAARLSAVVPGRGLAAPPPPSTGPPSFA